MCQVIGAELGPSGRAQLYRLSLRSCYLEVGCKDPIWGITIPVCVRVVLAHSRCLV